MSELREKSKDELAAMVADARKKAEEIRAGILRGEVKNVRTHGVLRRDIARMLTALNAKP